MVLSKMGACGMNDDKDANQALAQTASRISKIQVRQHHDNTNEESNSSTKVFPRASDFVMVL